MQRRLDLAGLCCIGLAVYLGYVIYLGWNGGAVGNGSQTALDYAVGAGGVVVPVALAPAGIGLILRPFLPSPKSVAVGWRPLPPGFCLPWRRRPPAFGPEGCARSVLIPGSSRITAAVWGDLYWATSTPSTGSGPTSSPSCPGFRDLLDRPLGVGHGPSRPPRSGARQRGTVGFATAIKESRVHTDPDLIDTTPADTEPVFGPP
jgi:hypothetical protein